jgi:putative cardiolipin synthase
VVESAELASQVIDFMDDGVKPENSYRVILETDTEMETERLVWITSIDGKEVRYYSEPETSLWRRFSVWLMGLLPAEKHL